jgi:hypothetical protein
MGYVFCIEVGKMSYTVELTKCHRLMQVLNAESRLRHQVPQDCVVVPYLEQDYDISINYSDPLFSHHPATATFSNEAHYVFLLMKYT